MYDVVIVGGGPVGVFAACELKLAGANPLVVERLPEINQWDKAHGLTGQVVRLLDHRGLFERCAGTSVPAPAPRFFFGALPLPLHVLGDHNPMYLLHINQRDLERVLNDRAAELGVEIRRGVEMRSFTQHDDSVTVDVVDVATGAASTVSAQYLVGSDGARSTVRKRSGIGFPGNTDHHIVDRTALIAPTAQLTPAGPGNVHVAGLGEIAESFHRTETGVVTIALRDPAHPLVYTAEWEDQPDRSFPSEGAAMTLTEMEDSLERVLGVRLDLDAPAADEPTLLRRLTGRNTRVADRYRDRRVFLLGDAAHVHSAAGGPGLNLALQDAANLAWKLAAALHGWAPAGLLDTYETERRPLGQRVFMQTQAQTALMAPGSDVTALRDLFAEMLADTTTVQRIGDLLAGSDVRYDMGCMDPDGPTGRFAPSTTVELVDGAVRRIPELLRTARPILLDATGGHHDTIAPWDDRVDHVPLATTHEQTSMLIRPDGFVAWSHTDPASLTEALSAWFGTPEHGCTGKE
ncbi:FAD-dependent monooxygenase [Curtobacterium poinsettiae]|uniref:FAD-dependent monooxygenase n=1 Tax=Curtobacterium TaxID=2034 RepID=UPI00217EBCE4|nr:FAD-dependent monooxygenase [Curtobacterium flaccumfaciens]MCS6562337.1 FAD-dependent monooxygenase [Curtobacterium flaccumfaciens pv. poinsettiae]UXN28401.1 FAD-dependent monooxygenase [Curtobacterium flaccumfaciens]